MHRLRHWLFRPSFPVIVAWLALALFMLTRIVLLAYTGTGNVPLSAWPHIFLGGLWFDLATLAYFTAPLLILRALLPNRLRAWKAYRLLRLVVLWFIAALLLFGSTAEFTFWQEFQTRFNFIAVDYLLYTQEVIGNIRESYPVGAILAGIGLAAAALLWPWKKQWIAPPTDHLSWRGRGIRLLAGLLLPLLATGLANIDQMNGSGNAYADELAGNGLFSLSAAMRRNELDYDRFYASLPQARADQILKSLGVERPALALGAVKPYQESPEALPGFLLRRPKHIVMITVESLSAEFLDSFGGQRHLTPHLDALAQQSYRFTQFFATGTRTVRGLEAVSLGIPPLPGQAVVRRPENSHLATLGEVLEHQGYRTHFIYGGYGYFDNMNAYFRNNDYQVVDRTDFPPASIPFANVWGVADEALFDNAVTALDQDAQTGKPFFAHIMTTSNHRPFTYPQGRIDIPSPGGRDGAVKYTDFAIGRFIETARHKPWFKDTLFVILADHCASAAGKTELSVKGYHIPLLLYGPDIIRSGVNTRRMSQIDLPPSLVDMLGLPGDDYFYGHSISDPAVGEERAFISNYQSLGYYKGNHLVILKPRQVIETYTINPDTLEAQPSPNLPALNQEVIAYYQTAAHAYRQGLLRLE